VKVKDGAEANARKWEGEKTKFNTDLAESNRVRDETHQQLLQTQAAKEQMEKRYGDYDTVKARVTELEAEVGSHKENIGKHEKELTGRIHQNLLASGASEDAIKDKTLDQLRNLEEAAKLFAGKIGTPKPANYDGGPSGPGAGSIPATPLDRAKATLDDHDRKKGKVTV
jgi:chromosome segregation ATPase